MAIRFYDDAIANKIISWLPKNKKAQIQVLRPDEVKKLFSIELDQSNDKPIQLPLIAISRDTAVDILHTTMQPMSFDGLMLEADTKHTLELDAIPISLSYQLDIYTRRYDEGDELLREFIFKLVNNPQIVVDLPYNNQHLQHISTITLQGQVEDTSNISERLFSGQFTRWTIRFNVQDAYLFNIPYVDNVEVNYELYAADNTASPFNYKLEDIIDTNDN